MSSDMSLRDLYLPPDTTIDLAAAKAKASDLCRHATVEDLRILIDNDWITGATVGGTDVSDLTDDGVAEHTERLRHLAEAHLYLLLEAFAASLQHRDVARFRYDHTRGTDTATATATGGGIAGVDAYVTGGISSGGSPTDSYDAWDIVWDTDRFPDRWPDEIGAAAGLLHPRGDGAAAVTVTFHAWA